MGLYISIPIFILASVAFLIGRKLSKNPDFNNVLMLGLLLSGAGHIMMTYPEVYFSFIFRVIHEIGDAILLTVMVIGVGHLFKKKDIGGEGALFGLITILAAFFSSLAFGPIGEIHGYHIPLIVSGIFSLSAIPLVYKFKKTFSGISNKKI